MLEYHFIFSASFVHVIMTEIIEVEVQIIFVAPEIICTPYTEVFSLNSSRVFSIMPNQPVIDMWEYLSEENGTSFSN